MEHKTSSTFPNARKATGAAPEKEEVLRRKYSKRLLHIPQARGSRDLLRL